MNGELQSKHHLTLTRSERSSAPARTSRLTVIPHSIAIGNATDRGKSAIAAMERLADFVPYAVAGPVEVKVGFTPKAAASFEPHEGVKQFDERTWLFRGKDVIEVWLKYSSS